MKSIDGWNDLAPRRSIQLESVGTRDTLSFSVDKLVLSSEHRTRDVKAASRYLVSSTIWSREIRRGVDRGCDVTIILFRQIA